MATGEPGLGKGLRRPDPKIMAGENWVSGNLCKAAPLGLLNGLPLSRIQLLLNALTK